MGNDPGTDSKQFRVFIPLVLVVAALLIMTGFQTLQLARERVLLRERIELQEEPIKESQNVRQQLESVARSTAELARRGNANAQKIVDELQKAGVTINLDAG